MISFVILAYNEEANIEITIETVMRAAQHAALDNFEMVVVDDGSTDRTAEIVTRLAMRNPQMRIVSNDHNLGIGLSIRSVLPIVKFDRVLFVPGDNDMSFELMRLLLCYRDTADLLLAFPINTEERTVWRNVLSVIYRLIHVVVFRTFVNYVNAPGVFPTAMLRALPLHSQRFSIVAEYTVKLLRSGCTFAEVPGFFQNPNRGKTRRTVTLKNFVEVVKSFARLCIEIHITHRSWYDRVPRRVFIDFAGGVIESPVVMKRDVTSVPGDRSVQRVKIRDVGA